MLFNSIEFAIFFPIVTIAYFLLPYRARWAWLLAASCLFYMFFIPQYIVILLVTILIDYWAAIGIENSPDPVRKKRYLVVSVISTCLVLAVFKYFNFFNANLKAVSELLGLHYPVPFLELILPIGLSFHTFQSLSYVVEVYRGEQKAERHFGIYSLYVMFYPQLVAGPIERPQNLLHQFWERHDFDYKLAAQGLRMMAWGLAKKVLLADRLSPIVDRVYSAPHEWSGPAVLAATFLFAIQIYCDFSGYSDIARGSARVMGFHLMRNFQAPYLSESVQEFWRRWHMSLSTWFKDYVYVPMGGSRVPRPRWIFNIMATFTLSGLWHGANWTYILWGALNGAYLVVESLLPKPRREPGSAKPAPTARPFWSWLPRALFTFALICVTWVFFRAGTLADALSMLWKSTLGLRVNAATIAQAKGIFSSRSEAGLVILGVACLFLLDWFHQRHDLESRWCRLPWTVRWLGYVAYVLCLALLGKFVNANFIYFQF